MAFVNKILFVLSDGMLVPVMVALMFYFVRALLALGGFFGQAVRRVRTHAAEAELVDGATPERLKAGRDALVRHETPFAFHACRMLADQSAGKLSERALAEAQLGFDKSGEGLRLLMRVGPMLGLMGTIIPMGPALTGLATGEIGMMAQNMQIAFATTSIGLFCGVVGFVLHTVTRRWHAEDMVGLAHVFEVLHEAG
jgi:biopolymer transport protein ExbB/TolQ